MKPCVPIVMLLAAMVVAPSFVFGAVGLFASSEHRVQQTAQSAFIDFDSKTGIQTWVIQTSVAGMGGPFGIVIPVPARPSADAVENHFLDSLDVFTRLKERRHPESRIFGDNGQTLTDQDTALPGIEAPSVGEDFVPVLDTAVIPAKRGDLLYAWLRERGFKVDGRQPIIARYVLNGFFFVVATIDPYYMRNADATKVFSGRTQPIRIQFRSNTLAWPLHMNRIGVATSSDTTFYLQAPYKVDLPDDFTYQYMWVSLLRSSQGKFGAQAANTLSGGGHAWLEAVRDLRGSIESQAATFGFEFEPGKRAKANADGFVPSSLLWCKKLSEVDLLVLSGKSRYSDPMPDVDAGFEALDGDNQVAVADAYAEVTQRIAKSRTFRPNGYVQREASELELANLAILQRALRKGQVLTRIHKPFQSGEVLGDIAFHRSGWNKLYDNSEYTELLPASPRD
ncbi:MAG: hypothetical protein ACI8W8_001528 [Rhodothermales bacterium]|jgi:hypothetical protein